MTGYFQEQRKPSKLILYRHFKFSDSNVYQLVQGRGTAQTIIMLIHAHALYLAHDIRDQMMTVLHLNLLSLQTCPNDEVNFSRASINKM